MRKPESFGLRRAGWRWRIALAAGVFLAVAATVAGVFLPRDFFWGVQLSDQGVAVIRTRPVPFAPPPVLFHDDFSHRTGVWDEQSTVTTIVRVAGGKLAIDILRRDMFFFQTLPLQRDVGAVSVEARMETGHPNRPLFGLYCAESAGPDARAAGGAGGYAVLLRRGSARIKIGRIPPPLTTGITDIRLLATARLTARPAKQPVALRIECGTNPGDGRFVTVYADGRKVATARDRGRTAAFDGGGLMIGNIDRGRATLRVDEFVIRDRSKRD
jgi:hypothetical protein